MTGSWRFILISALAAALLLPAGAALAMEQPALEELEVLLHDLGFDPGPVDGVVDEDTIAAIRRYQDFALLPGTPEPSEALLNELRGVAAAFAALRANGPEQPAAAPGSTEPDATDKVIVPPPPPPPKLKPLDAIPEMAPTPAPPQEAARPPATDDVEETEELPADVAMDPALLNDPGVVGTEAEAVDPIAEGQARIDAELASYRKALNDGSLTREDLAKQFNQEGRELLKTANYDAAILKFSVAIFLNPNFAGAYSNRGTAYQHREESDLAKADFDKARELGFGGFRVRDAENPLK